MPERFSKRKKALKRVKVTITLRKQVLDGVDGLAEMAETTRSDVIDSFVDYCLKTAEIINEFFPLHESLGELEGEVEVEDEREEVEEEDD